MICFPAGLAVARVGMAAAAPARIASPSIVSSLPAQWGVLTRGHPVNPAVRSLTTRTSDRTTTTPPVLRSTCPSSSSPLSRGCWSPWSHRLSPASSMFPLCLRQLHTSPSTRSAASPAASQPPPVATSAPEPTAKVVGYHSLFLAFLVYAIILVGGLTRLTESGLSITEWNPGFKGMWLPSTDEEWEGEWAKYRQTPEFLLLNSKMSLSDFKSIYMWEWSHRILGRLIGAAYVLPALYFVARGYVKPPFRSKLLLIGLGIGAQGAMGWYMVKSGLAAPEGTLSVDGEQASSSSSPSSSALAPSSTPASWTPRVSHFRLAAHLGLAFIVYAGMLRTGLSILRENNLARNIGKASGVAVTPGTRERLATVLSHPLVQKNKRFVAAVTGLVFVTAMSGALVAGLDAGLVYNEFPTMGDGRIAPPLDEMFDERYARAHGSKPDPSSPSPPSTSLVAHNLTQNPVTVQFVHRCLAITTFAHVALVAWKTRKLNIALKAAGTSLPPAVPRLAILAFATATLQASLGISTLIYMVPIELASAHQAGSVALLSVMLALWGVLRVPSSQGIVAAAKQAASVAQAARSGSAVSASAAAGAPRMAFSTLAQSRKYTTAAAQRPWKDLRDLPDKVKLRTGPSGRLAKVLPPRETYEITTRVGSSYGGSHSLEWLEAPRNLLIVIKRHDDKTIEAMKDVIAHVNATYPAMNVIVEDHHIDCLQGSRVNNVAILTAANKALLARKNDIVITLGGDGTILHASSLFERTPVPPVLSFSMGTLGFLLPWNIQNFRTALDDLVKSRVSLLLRMRLRQTVHECDGSLVAAEGEPQEVHLMNEVTLHRGRQPHMTTIDAFVDGRHFTQAISDGLIIASPTGSTAYSLSAGGPIVHPSVQSLVLTPICPRSLSFRPVLLPSDSKIQLKISRNSRSPAELTIDGREIRVLQPGQFLQISMSPFPIPCVNRAKATSTHVETAIGRELDGELQAAGAPDAESVLIEPQSSIERMSEKGTRAAASGREEPLELDSDGDRAKDDDGWVRDLNQLLRFNASFAGRGRGRGAS